MIYGRRIEFYVHNQHLYARGWQQEIPKGAKFIGSGEKPAIPLEDGDTVKFGKGQSILVKEPLHDMAKELNDKVDRWRKKRTEPFIFVKSGKLFGM